MFLFLVGTLVGSAAIFLYFHLKLNGLSRLSERILNEAEKKKDEILDSIKLKESDTHKLLEKEKRDQEERLQKEKEKQETRLEKIEFTASQCLKKLNEIEKRELQLLEKEEALKERVRLFEAELEKRANLTQEEAKKIVFDRGEKELQIEFGKLALKLKNEAEESASKHAKELITTAINRLAVPTVSEVAVTTVPIPHDEMKGRIIGREGRNIRALEVLTGINISVDDTPNTILLSGFDPIRKEIAKQTLLELIQDGRIHPTRIEEVVAKREELILEEIKERGEKAAFEASIFNLHPELLKLLGKLSYRYSFGQNVLAHSLEVAHIMGLLAAELELDVHLAKRIGLLHDIGKAVTQESEGSHALVGLDLALKYGENEAVANGIGCHHHEIPPTTLEGSLCSAADAISAARPQARSEALEQMIKRLKKLEMISSEYEGVEKVYALGSGKEIRVIVIPEVIDDKGSILLARKIARKIEGELTFPGKIKVTVIREKKVVEYAT